MRTYRKSANSVPAAISRHTRRINRLRFSGKRPICRKQMEMMKPARVARIVRGASESQCKTGSWMSHADAPAVTIAMAPVMKMRERFGG